MNFICIPPCHTSWSLGGWRAWRDRILYGHVAHTCRHTDHGIGVHVCRCGARCGLILRMPEPDPDYEDPGISERRPRP